MVYNSLVTAPSDMKEAIDWMAAVKATGGAHSLAEAVAHLFHVGSKGGYDLGLIEEVRHHVKLFLQKPGLKEHAASRQIIKKIVETCIKFIRTTDDDNAEEEKAKSKRRLRRKHRKKSRKKQSEADEKLAEDHKKYEVAPDKPPVYIISSKLTEDEIKKGVQDSLEKFDTLLKKIRKGQTYVPTYSTAAEWERCCAPDPLICAQIFVGIAPLLYATSRMLRYVTTFTSGIYKIADESKKLGQFFRLAGYNVESDINARKTVDIFRFNVNFITEDFAMRLNELSGFVKI
ncbi:hypothetical protein, conserved [Babesia bigemina]|uniref:Uncharacterized protein n=1 Tax=Babesia bigemina TaxID=5866 RepID=A0A061DC49_BABBI|nr:hypothetical protein, conserved [Babesia bigemina]CDR96514.1 hypothetical protein, conserved [Babesia bigemina]|eukprot:XP_012768700.1 hypothetical protein, conserved [Babesia bigemina]